MLQCTVSSCLANLLPGTIHWSSKAQVKGTSQELRRLGNKPTGRTRNRERRPIYILATLRNGSYLVLFVFPPPMSRLIILILQFRTCTTRHQLGFDDVPENERSSYLPIEPSSSVTRPIVYLGDDDDHAFAGKSLLFVEVPIVAFADFFRGYIGQVTPESKELIERECLGWQLRRVEEISHHSRITAVLAVLHAEAEGMDVHGLGEGYKTAVRQLTNEHSVLYAGNEEVVRTYLGDRVSAMETNALQQVSKNRFSKPNESGRKKKRWDGYGGCRGEAQQGEDWGRYRGGYQRA
jgi:hypothetical protein